MTSEVSRTHTGCVKWFNNKAGYGFITLNNSELSGTDIFVHHTAVEVSNEQYRYLFQGEYVELNVSTIEGSEHKHQATNVRGINGGKLMCETRNESRISKNNYRLSKQPIDTNESSWTNVLAKTTNKRQPSQPSSSEKKPSTNNKVRPQRKSSNKQNAVANA
jgi:CspA family cold shock protein